MNMQRVFTYNLLLSSTTVLHTFASSLKVARTLHGVTAFHEEFDMNEVLKARDTDELVCCASLFLQSSSKKESCNMESWKVLRQGEHGIVDDLIPNYAWNVLRTLEERGYETYLVGGSVRDMLLNQAPKDFDVLTTAEPKQVRRNFNRSMIVGRRFPVCHVHIGRKIIEVSSFSTAASVSRKARLVGSRINSDLARLKDSSASNQRHHARWQNSLRRDFTINGLLYDPFKKILYDYVGGIEDLKKMKVRTVVSACESFEEDNARILRALRIGARLGFKFSRDTAKAIQSQYESVQFLNKERLRMETNYMLSYGAAEPSIRLLWRFGLLEILLPPQAAYLAAQGFKRQDKNSNMLLDLMANLDRLLRPSQPCHCCLWVNLLALHMALVDQPQHPMVVSALAIAIHGNMKLGKASQRAIKIHEKFGDMSKIFPEVDVECSNITTAMIKQKVLQLCDDAVNALHMMNNSEYVSSAMWRHPGATTSDFVIVSKQLLIKCKEMFLQLDCTSKQRDSEQKLSKNDEETRKNCIDHAALQEGLLGEVGFVFSHIVMSTLYPHAGKRKKSYN